MRSITRHQTTGSLSIRGFKAHCTALMLMVLMVTDSRSVSSNSSTVRGNSKAMNSVRWLQEQPTPPSASTVVLQPSVDQNPSASFQKRHWTIVSQLHDEATSTRPPLTSIVGSKVGSPMHGGRLLLTEITR